MDKERPLLVVVSIVRNEAWVLEAFLSAASLWADMIVIADQMSTDGSREIYKRYPKVHVIDNDRPNMHQAASRRLALDEARRLLNGNTNAVLFALDADEILEGDFVHSKAWQQILESKPNDCFEWSWMNLVGKGMKYSKPSPLYWGAHVSEQIWDGEFPDNNIHEWRLPFPSPYDNEIVLHDFYSIHMAALNVKRVKNKQRFYQINSAEDTTRYNMINIYRQYHSIGKTKTYDVPDDMYVYYEKHGLDVLAKLNLEDEGAHYTQEIKDYIAKNGVEKYAMLDIWDADWCARNGIDTPKRTVMQKVVMWYLKKSNPYARTLVVRGIDKVLKRVYSVKCTA